MTDEEKENTESFDDIIDLSSMDSDEPKSADDTKQVEKKIRHPRNKLPWILLSITLLGLAIRLGLMLMETRVYVDGVHYLLQGENIRERIWDTWDPNGSRWTIPPFYPLLIALVRSFTTDLVLSGQIASLLVSISIIPGAYLLGSRIFGKREGLWAAFIAAINPVCTHYAIVTYAESAFMALVVWTVYFSIVAISSENKILPTVLTGLFAAMAYLTKAFGLVFFAWGIVVMAYYLLRKLSGFKKKLVPLGLYIAAFLIIAIPYWIFLFSYHGHWVPDGKSLYEFNRIYAPTLEEERIDPRYEGLITDDFEYTILQGIDKHEPGSDFPKIYIKKYIKKLMEIFLDYPVSQVPPFVNVRLTSPLFLLLLGVGLFAVPLTLIKSQGIRILLAWLLAWFFIAPLSFIEIRYFVPLIPLLIPIAGSGATRLEDWFRNTAVFSKPSTQLLIVPVIGFILFLFALPSLTYKLTNRDDPTLFYNEYKEAGEFMKHHLDGAQEPILESAHMISFYADLPGWVIPNTDFNTLTAFMLKHDLRYLAIDEYLTMIKHRRPAIDPLFSFIDNEFIDTTDETSPLLPIYWDDKYVGHRVVIYKLNDDLVEAWQEKKSQYKTVDLVE